jgi:hypothetical protein
MWQATPLDQSVGWCLWSGRGQRHRFQPRGAVSEATLAKTFGWMEGPWRQVTFLLSRIFRTVAQALERASLPPPQSLWRDRLRGRGEQGTLQDTSLLTSALYRLSRHPIARSAKKILAWRVTPWFQTTDGNELTRMNGRLQSTEPITEISARYW